MKDQLHPVPTAASGLALAAVATSAAAQSISEQAVIDAQTTWGEGIVAIATVHADGGDCTARATEHINDLYSYGETDVMFKPTLEQTSSNVASNRSNASQACSARRR